MSVCELLQARAHCNRAVKDSRSNKRTATACMHSFSMVCPRIRSSYTHLRARTRVLFAPTHPHLPPFAGSTMELASPPGAVMEMRTPAEGTTRKTTPWGKEPVPGVPVRDVNQYQVQLCTLPRSFHWSSLLVTCSSERTHDLHITKALYRTPLCGLPHL